MNPAQVHLALNHLPIVGLLIGTLVLIAAALLKLSAVKKTGLVILAVSALTVLPVYLTGEPTEEIVEHKPLVLERHIHDHEELAEVALVFTLLAGIGALGTLAAAKVSRLERFERQATGAVLLLSLITTGVLMRTAHLGGLIRHDELRSGVAAEPLEKTAAAELTSGGGTHD